MRMARPVLFAILAWSVLAAAARAGTPFDDGVWTEVTIARRPLTQTSAPADEYFGAQRLSNLGMRNMVHFMTLEGTSPLALQGQIANIDGVTAGLTAWMDKYPRDPWLPDTILKFAEFLQSKAQPFADAAAVSYLLLLEERFAGTPQAGEAAKVLDGYHQTPAFDVTALPLPQRRAGAADILPRRRG
jgi:hypothetical protein